MTFGGCVQLLFEHTFIDWTDRELWATKNFSARFACLPEGIFGNHAACAARELFRAVGFFVQPFAFAPLLSVIGIIDCHAHDTDRCVNAPEGAHRWNTPPGADNHFAVNLIAQNSIGAAHVTFDVRRNGSGFDAEAMNVQRFTGIDDDLVFCGAPLFQREVKRQKVKVIVNYIGIQDAQRFDQQFLSGLVALQNHNGTSTCHKNLSQPGRTPRYDYLES